jgi:membrane fusion protein (multidrug efflux system)
MEAVAKKPVLSEEAAGAPAGEKKRSKPFLILGAVAVATLLGIGAYMMITGGHESTDDAQIEADVVPIAARVAGQVRKVYVAENQAVKKGMLLLELDDADYAAREKQAEAELDTASAQAQAADSQAQVATAGARGGFASAQAMVSGSAVAVQAAEAQIASAKAGLRRAESDAHKAEMDLARTKELRAANAVPQEKLDNTLADVESTQAALLQARANLNAAEEARRAATSRVGEARGRLDQSAPVSSQIAVAQANARLAHARVKSAEAALELAKLQLSYTKISAQEDGLVSRLGVHEGQLVTIGQPMAALVPNRPYVVANFKETQIGRMKPGQKVEIAIDAFSGEKLEGKVESLSGGTGSRFSLLPPDNASGNFVKVVQRVPVRIALTRIPQELTLRAGLSADVTVDVK